MKRPRRLAQDNPLWGAERIRGELLKLGSRVAEFEQHAFVFGCRGGYQRFGVVGRRP